MPKTTPLVPLRQQLSTYIRNNLVVSKSKHLTPRELVLAFMRVTFFAYAPQDVFMALAKYCHDEGVHRSRHFVNLTWKPAPASLLDLEGSTLSKGRRRMPSCSKDATPVTPVESDWKWRSPIPLRNYMACLVPADAELLLEIGCACGELTSVVRRVLGAHQHLDVVEPRSEGVLSLMNRPPSRVVGRPLPAAATTVKETRQKVDPHVTLYLGSMFDEKILPKGKRYHWIFGNLPFTTRTLALQMIEYSVQYLLADGAEMAVILPSDFFQMETQFECYAAQQVYHIVREDNLHKINYDDSTSSTGQGVHRRQTPDSVFHIQAGRPHPCDGSFPLRLAFIGDTRARDP